MEQVPKLLLEEKIGLPNFDNDGCWRCGFTIYQCKVIEFVNVINRK